MSLHYLIDTDWVIHYLHAHAGIVARLDELQPQGLALSIISLAELSEGVFYSRDPEGDEQDLADFLRGVTVLGLDTDSAKLFGRVQYSSAGHRPASRPRADYACSSPA
jgi:tRNA(fMet)-specific endonuclease VapC